MSGVVCWVSQDDCMLIPNYKVANPRVYGAPKYAPFPDRVTPLYSQATLNTLRAQLEAAEADAARYRWLKSNHLQTWADTKTGAVSSCDFSFEAKGTWEMDAAIDSEIARTKEQQA